MADSMPSTQQQTVAMGQLFDETELESLRRLLLGPEYQVILKKIEILDDPVKLGQLITPAIREALKLKTPDSNVQEVLAPTVIGALMDSVSSDPKPVANVLYPVMGPAIRQSISVAMEQMTNNFNQLLEHSVSPQSLRWRVDAWLTGKRYAEIVLIKNLVFQVEQVFLIHRETGLLLQHVLADTAISKDPDMVSGMLTAIQDFTNDSFSVEQSSGLNSLRLGDLTVLIENGPQALLATVIRGTVPNDLQNMLTETIEVVHQHEHKRLGNYQGDSSTFDHLQPLLSQCLKTQLISKKTKQKAKPSQGAANKQSKLFKYGAGLIGLIALSWGLYSYYQSSLAQDEWLKVQQTLRSEPGLVITHTAYNAGRYHISGLADPLAKNPSELINYGTLKNIAVDLAFSPYLSLDPDIALKRVHQAFDIPDAIVLKIENGVLGIIGKSTQSWLDKFTAGVSNLGGISRLDTSEISIIE
ncbi:MAG: hypothetical protein ACPG47_05425 [Leucothrix sp.]